jgi:hypothetical protein
MATDDVQTRDMTTADTQAETAAPKAGNDKAIE